MSVGVVLTKLTYVRRPSPLRAVPYPRRRVFESEHKQASEYACVRCSLLLAVDISGQENLKFLLGVSHSDET